MPSDRYKVRIRRFVFRVSAVALLSGLLGFLSGGAIYLLTHQAGAGIVTGLFVVGVGSYGGYMRMFGRRLTSLLGRLEALRTMPEDAETLSELPRGPLFDVMETALEATRDRLAKELERLKHMENYRREFLGDVSHELKTPIFAIQGFVETLLEGALEDEEVNRDFLYRIQRNAERLDALVGDLLQISRLETGELTMQLRPFDIAELIEHVCDTLGPMARERNVTLTYDMPPDLPPVVGDAERLRQVLINLVDNAIKYNRPGGRVTVRVQRAASHHVLIEVEDTGVGIPPEALPRLTERFFRVDRSRARAQGGTGLGLSIVKHILAAHHTQLVVRSKEQVGSTFSFSLPLHTAAIHSS